MPEVFDETTLSYCVERVRAGNEQCRFRGAFFRIALQNAGGQTNGHGGPHPAIPTWQQRLVYCGAFGCRRRQRKKPNDRCRSHPLGAQPEWGYGGDQSIWNDADRKCSNLVLSGTAFRLRRVLETHERGSIVRRRNLSTSNFRRGLVQSRDIRLFQHVQRHVQQQSSITQTIGQYGHGL